MSTPLVSVVMNVRNGAPWLREAIDSVLAQTFTDWELVVWDDRSTDDSAAVVAGYADPRIRYFLAEDDTPLGKARNLAVSVSRGEWIAFLDQDDIWLPQKLEHQVQLALRDDQGKVGLIYGRTVEFFPDGRVRDFDHHHEFEALPEGNLLVPLLQKACFIAISSAMFRRTALEPVPDELQLISDYFLFVAVSRRFESRAVQQVVCRYRRHSTSLSQSHRRRLYEEGLLLLDRWEPQLPVEPVREARRNFHTAIGLCELSIPAAIAMGMARILLKGSLFYVLSRPWARTLRLLRSSFGLPRWRASNPSHAVQPPGASAPAAGPVKLSIIVVSWRVRELLRECLQSVYAQISLPQTEFELFVVDNDSQDGSAEMVAREFSHAKLMANADNAGFARGNNQAFRQCQGRFVLLLNPDATLIDDSIHRMLDLLEQTPGAAAIGCRLLNSDRTLQPWTAGALPGVSNIACHFLFLYKLLPERWLPRPLFMEAEPERDTDVGWVSGACMLLRREALHNAIFDERYFMYGEDLHLCQLLVDAGWRVIYTPGSEVIHHGGSSIDQQTPEVQLQKIGNLRRAFATNHGKGSLIGFDFFVAIGFLIRLIGFRFAAATRPGRGYDLRAAKSGRFLAESVRLLWQHFPKQRSVRA